MKFGIVIYYLLLTAILLAGIYRWRSSARGEKIITCLILCTLAEEIVAFIYLKKSGHNLFTYHFYSPIELFLTCLYFNATNQILKKRNIGLITGFVGLIVSAINTCYFQPLSTFNSYFVAFEATTIIILCLFSLYEILLADILSFHKTSYFWITICLLFYWSMTYTGWGLFNFIAERNRWLVKTFISVVYYANFIFYIGIALVFFNYKKLNRSGT